VGIMPAGLSLCHSLGSRWGRHLDVDGRPFAPHTEEVREREKNAHIIRTDGLKNETADSEMSQSQPLRADSFAN
jgi:hypothetical protein